MGVSGRVESEMFSVLAREMSSRVVMTQSTSRVLGAVEAVGLQAAVVSSRRAPSSFLSKQGMMAIM